MRQGVVDLEEFATFDLNSEDQVGTWRDNWKQCQNSCRYRCLVLPWVLCISENFSQQVAKGERRT